MEKMVASGVYFICCTICGVLLDAPVLFEVIKAHSAGIPVVEIRGSAGAI